MKNKYLIIALSLLIVMFCNLNKTYSQSTSSALGNFPSGCCDYLGWAATVGRPLSINNNDPQSIHFLTFGLPRMQIFDTTASICGNRGYVGIGDFTQFQPQSPFHLHNDSSSWQSVFMQITNSYTNWNSNLLGMRMGLSMYGEGQIRVEGGGPYNQNLPLEFWVNAATPLDANARERVYIWAGDSLRNNYNNEGFDDVTRVGIWEWGLDSGSSLTNMPMALLQLGEPQDPNFAGHRNWMDVGTYSNLNTDNMYSGLKILAINRTDAVINWGDDPSNVANIGDRLIFNFTSDTANATTNAQKYDGLEIERMWTNGNIGRVGIGGDTTATPRNFYRNFPNLNSADPNNTLEINSPDTSDLQTIGGNSGLRLTDLTARSHPILNWKGNLLSVDSAGDVVSVQFKDTNSFGFAHCPGDSLIHVGPNHDVQMNLDSNNVYFNGDPSIDGQGAEINSVGIGYTACTAASPLLAKLDVLRSKIGPKPTTPIGIRVINHDQTFAATDTAFGIYSLTDGPNNYNYAGFYVDSAAANNYGIYSTATGHFGKTFYGVYGNGDGHVLGTSLVNVNNYGVYGNATCIDTSKFNFNFGVYGNVPLTDTANQLTWAGWFNGKVTVVGSVHCATVFQTSDQQFKQNITPISDALGILNNLTPKTYFWKTNDYPQMRFSSAKQWGLISQDVQQVLPELIENSSVPPTTDSAGNIIYPKVDYAGLNYTELIPIIIKGTQQLDSAKQAQKSQIDNLNSTVNNLRNQINDLTTQINNCCNNGSRTSSGGNGNGSNNNGINNSNIANIDVTLGSKSIVLMQNVPNPFKEQTVISYFIPDNLTDVSIIFTDNLGNIIKQVPIVDHGQGQLTVYAQDLSSGIYTYTIISNGITIDSKRMVKTK